MRRRRPARPALRHQRQRALTRGSTRNCLPVNLASTRSTAGMSASTKFSSTPSCAAAAACPAGRWRRGIAGLCPDSACANSGAARLSRPRRATPARCAGLRRRGHGRRRRPGLRGGRQRHGQRRQAIQPRLRRVGATAAVRRRATGKRGQYGHAHDLAPGRRAGGLRQAILRHCVTSRSGWRGQLDRCAVLIQKRHSGWRHGALTRYFQHRDGRPGPGGGRIDAAQVDPVRPQRQTPRLRQQPAQQGFGPRVLQAQAPAAIRPGAVTSACKPACSRPRRSDASVAGPRAVCSRGALASNVSSSMLAAQARQFGARALGLASAGSISDSQHSAASASRRSRPACGARAAPVRANNSRRARVRDALAPCRERAAARGRNAKLMSGSRVPRPAAARGAGASRRLSTDTPSLAAALIQSGVPLPAPGHGARGRHLHIQRAVRIAQAGHFAGGEGQMLRGRAQQERELRLPGTALQLLADLAQGIGHAGQGGERLLHTAMHVRAQFGGAAFAARPATAGRRSTPWRRWRPI